MENKNVEDVISDVITRIVIAKTGKHIVLDRHASIIDNYGIDSLEMINCLMEIETALKLSSVEYGGMSLSSLHNIVSLSDFYKQFFK
ncbi:MAG: hypothetical protein LBG80_18860 [Bacteroidales bacterium]|jgi:acyl carrier protein|nr:hypothetical protein [Bacteroidales bacterium]